MAASNPVIFLMGPTASGKTGLAVELFQKLPVELVSVDSALVYRGMDIGTAKPDATTLAAAPHRLIDIIDPVERYSAAQFRTDALQAIEEIGARGKVPLLVGGTMLYFNALQHGLSQLPEADHTVRESILARAAVEGWPALHAELARVDPLTAARLQPNDAQRIERALEIFMVTGHSMSAHLANKESAEFPFRLLKIALAPADRSVLHQRIADRFDAMIDQGLIDELRQLRRRYPALDPTLPSMRCVGYRQAWQRLDGEISADEFRDKGIAATRQLAKRQLTWLRGMADTTEVDCLDEKLSETVFHLCNSHIEN